jgi:hypothetical protein
VISSWAPDGQARARWAAFAKEIEGLQIDAVRYFTLDYLRRCAGDLGRLFLRVVGRPHGEPSPIRRDQLSALGG